ncbi:LacI family DNA-binding transcriptional regulator [Streptomyces sp. NPDC046900]|uniref:LacI family DNA-binding transcriptional regulator n=1 Tax=Streptomyces sp. NPDC046900 TaxID=3155473 RepID=UPI0033C16402
MADVARAAGVSTSTVSHVLNETRAVRPETREQVLAAIARTGYRPNAVARALVTSSTNTIGLAISLLSNPYFGDLVHAIEADARAAGYTLVLGDTHDDGDIEQHIVRELQARQIDGLIIAPSAEAAHTTLPQLMERGFPVVLIDRAAPVEVDQVATENTAAAAELVGHLAELGHRRIGMVSGRAGLSTTTERLAGYQEGLVTHGLSVDPALVVEGGSNPEQAHDRVLELLTRPSPPTGLFVGNNAMTIGAMRAIRELGMRVPEDVALVCFDDFQWADLFEPRLTTMAQQVAEIGRESLALLLSRLRQPDLPARRIRIQPQMKHRQSCGCPR